MIISLSGVIDSCAYINYEFFHIDITNVIPDFLIVDGNFKLVYLISSFIFRIIFSLSIIYYHKKKYEDTFT